MMSRVRLLVRSSCQRPRSMRLSIGLTSTRLTRSCRALVLLGPFRRGGSQIIGEARWQCPKETANESRSFGQLGNLVPVRDLLRGS